jgi:hypothetical protein
MFLLKTFFAIAGISILITLACIYGGLSQLEKNNGTVESLIQNERFKDVDLHFIEHGGIHATLSKMQRRADNLRRELKIQQREITEDESRTIALIFLQGYETSDGFSKIHFYKSVENLSSDIKSFLTEDEYTAYKDKYIEITTNYYSLTGIFTLIQKFFR